MLHSTIIASASDYFKLHLTTAVGKDSLGHSTVAVTPKYDLIEEVDTDQMESAVAVLELMYTHQLPAEVSIRMILSMLQVRRLQLGTFEIADVSSHSWVS